MYSVENFIPDSIEFLQINISLTKIIQKKFCMTQTFYAKLHKEYFPLGINSRIVTVKPYIDPKVSKLKIFFNHLYI